MKFLKTLSCIFSVRRIIVLVSFWGLCFWLLLHFTNPFNISTSIDTNLSSFKLLPNNEFGAFSACHYSQKNVTEPGWLFSFDHLKVTQAKLGFFNTALCKEIILEDMSFHLHSYTATPKKTKHKTSHSSNLSKEKTVNPKAKSDVGKKTAIFSADFNNFRNRIYDRLSSLFDTPDGLILNIPDMAQTIGLNTNKFHFHWFIDNHEQLAIQSQRASYITENKNSIILKGAVKITSPNCVIQGNHVVWDIKQQRFYFEGGYAMTTPKEKLFGQDTYFDTDLNILHKETAIAKGNSTCQAKRF